jgi:glyoxylase-like metal-dependent hydrolase (beta-lactamase superfamily II)
MKMARTLVVVGIAIEMLAGGAGAQTTNRVVTIYSLNAYDILYVLSGGGLNAMALMQDDGVALIDPLPAGWGSATLDAISTVSDQPVTTIVNIRASEEFLRANLEFLDATTIVAHRNLAERVAAMGIFVGASTALAPKTVVTDQMTLFDGPDRMDLRYFGPGRTDGDLVVVFPEKRVAYLGDLLPSKAAPVIDRPRGGSGVQLPATLAAVIAQVTGIRTVVPGREPPTVGAIGTERPGAIMPMTVTMSWKDLEEYADFARDFVTAARQAAPTSGSPPEAAAALQLPERYRAYGMETAAAAVIAIQAELNGQ